MCNYLVTYFTPHRQSMCTRGCHVGWWVDETQVPTVVPSNSAWAINWPLSGIGHVAAIQQHVRLCPTSLDWAQTGFGSGRYHGPGAGAKLVLGYLDSACWVSLCSKRHSRDCQVSRHMCAALLLSNRVDLGRNRYVVSQRSLHHSPYLCTKCGSRYVYSVCSAKCWRLPSITKNHIRSQPHHHITRSVSYIKCHLLCDLYTCAIGNKTRIWVQELETQGAQNKDIVLLKCTPGNVLLSDTFDPRPTCQ